MASELCTELGSSSFFLLLIFWLGTKNCDGLPECTFISQVVGQLGPSVCGKKGSLYVEKFIAERRARPKDQQDARRMCRSCYKAAMMVEQQDSVPLPGM